MVEPRDDEPSITQPVVTVHKPIVGPRAAFRERCRTQARETGRIQPFDNGLHIATRLFGRHVARRGRHGQDVEAWVKQRHGKSDRIVDSRIAVDDHLPGHALARCRTLDHTTLQYGMLRRLYCPYPLKQETTRGADRSAIS